MPCPASACRFPAASPCTPHTHPTSGAPFYEASTRVHAIHPSGLPSPVNHRMGRQIRHARALGSYHGRLEAKINKLEETLRARRDVEKAIWLATLTGAVSFCIHSMVRP